MANIRKVITHYSDFWVNYLLICPGLSPGRCGWVSFSELGDELLEDVIETVTVVDDLNETFRQFYSETKDHS